MINKEVLSALTRKQIMLKDIYCIGVNDFFFHKAKNLLAHTHTIYIYIYIYIYI